MRYAIQQTAFEKFMHSIGVYLSTYVLMSLLHPFQHFFNKSYLNHTHCQLRCLLSKYNEDSNFYLDAMYQFMLSTVTM